ANLDAILGTAASAVLDIGRTSCSNRQENVNFSAADSAFDFLAVGQTLTVTYNVTVSDGHGGSAQTPVRVTCNAANDAPAIPRHANAAFSEAANQTGVATPDVAQATVSFNDVDLNDTHASPTAGYVSGAWTCSGSLPANLDAILGSAASAVL